MLVLRSLFFYGRAAFSRIWLNVPFCYLLSKDSVLCFLRGPPGVLAVNRRLYLPTSVLKLNFLFQTSTNEKDGVFSMGQSFGFFPSPTIPSGYDNGVTCILFFVQPIIGHGVRVALAFILTWIRYFVQQVLDHRVQGIDLHSPTVLAVSPWALLIQTP